MGIVQVIWYFAISAAFVISATTAAIADKRVPNEKAEIQLSFAPLVAKAVPAVVNILTRKIVRPRRNIPLFDDPFFRQFFRPSSNLVVTPLRRNIIIITLFKLIIKRFFIGHSFS